MFAAELNAAQMITAQIIQWLYPAKISTNFE